MKSTNILKGLGALAAVAVGTSAHAADRYWSGSGTWDTTTANWGAVSGGPYDSTWAGGDNAIFEGAGGTVTLGEDITVNNLTFTATGNYTISGGTLNFAPGGTIDMAGEDRNQTITSGITGSPAVRIRSGAHNPYNQITFAPESGTQTLGDVLSPYWSGAGDKGRVTLGGSTTGNTVGHITYEQPHSPSLHYGLVEKVDSGTWTVNGDLEAGVIHIQSGTLIVNGTISSLYQGLLNYGIPSGSRLSGNCTYYENDARFGPFTVNAGGIVAPGDHGIGTLTTSWGTARSDARTTTFSDGSIYEWEVGDTATDTVHILRDQTVLRPRALVVGSMILKILDAGGTPAATDQLPVFTYDDGVTRDLGTVTYDTSELGDTWDTSTLSLVDDGAGTIYLTGLSNVTVPFRLTITPNGANYDFSWDSKDGKRYSLVSSTDLSTAPVTWPVWDGRADIAGTAPTNMVSGVPGGGPARFFAVLEQDPPPVTVLGENFDGVTAPDLPDGWTVGANTPPDAGTTQWQLGTPSAVGPATASSAPNCVGTNLGGDYGANTDIWLRTPAIDLTAAAKATLALRQFRDIENVPGIDLDFGSIRIRAADDLAELAVLEAAVEGSDTDWQDYSKTLPAEAFTEAIVIEFRFEADEIDNRPGWYIDDVTVTVP